MKENNTVAVIVFLVAATLVAAYLLSPSNITGMSSMREGRATINFSVCGDNQTQPNEQCEPPGSPTCPGGAICRADCTCPPPPGGAQGGSAAAAAECCRNILYYDKEYLCECFIQQYGVIKLQPTVCCSDPENEKCDDFCRKLEEPQEQFPTIGLCPVSRMCGSLCCNIGEECRNGQCIAPGKQPQKEVQLTPPPELPVMITIPYTTYAFPWWYFILAAIILFILAYILWKKANEKPKPKKRRKRK